MGCQTRSTFRVDSPRAGYYASEIVALAEDSRSKGISILGATGSIGTTTLRLIDRFPDRFHVVALAAGKRVAEMKELAERYRPKIVSVAEPGDAAELATALGDDGPRVLHGAAGLAAVATAQGTDLLVSALVGAVGLEPTLAAIDAGIDIGLANKEVMVVGGELVRSRADAAAVRVLPIDSEHNAIFQALEGRSRGHVRRILLTASGGPFREHSRADLENVTRDEALNHPTWDMGDKITIDSATLMNKGLEVIEARWFFDFSPSEISVVIHPQSVIHSMVEYRDGTVISVLGIPDMTIPVGHVLAYPDLLDLGYLPRLDLPERRELTFFEPDTTRFTCLALAFAALDAGGTMPAVTNAANEIAVARFLADDIPFMAIPEVIGAAMHAHSPTIYENVDALLEADQWARDLAADYSPSELVASQS